MRLSSRKQAAVLFASLVLMALSTDRALTAAQTTLPNPVLVFTGQEFYTANGKQMTRYKFAVDNREVYPNQLFAAAPELPPCGTNTKASRTWVDLYDQSGKRLYGFCALGNHDGLTQLWFVLESDVVPPSWVYLEMTDRKTNTKYKSNLADTVM